MRLVLPVFCFVALLSFSACSREEVVVLKEADVKAKIDSIVDARGKEARRRAAEDLEQRSAIEVKVKTDSILEARKNGVAPASAAPASSTLFVPPFASDREP